METFSTLLHKVCAGGHSEEYKAIAARLKQMAPVEYHKPICDPIDRQHFCRCDVRHDRRIEHHAHMYWASAWTDKPPVAVLIDETIDLPLFARTDRREAAEHMIREPNEPLLADWMF